jgi:hypothetical protein
MRSPRRSGDAQKRLPDGLGTQGSARTGPPRGLRHRRRSVTGSGRRWEACSGTVGSVLRVGSAKTNIRHLEAAAGRGPDQGGPLLDRGESPTSISSSPTQIPLDELGLRVQTASERGPGVAAELRVSSFGLGGTNTTWWSRRRRRRGRHLDAEPPSPDSRPVPLILSTKGARRSRRARLMDLSRSRSVCAGGRRLVIGDHRAALERRAVVIGRAAISAGASRAWRRRPSPHLVEGSWGGRWRRGVRLPRPTSQWPGWRSSCSIARPRSRA